MGKPYNPIPALGAFGRDFLNKQNVIVSGTLSEMGVKGSNTISEAINTIDIGNAGLQDSLANVMTLGKNVYGELHQDRYSASRREFSEQIILEQHRRQIRLNSLLWKYNHKKR